MNLHLRKNGTEYGPHTELEIRDLYNERVVSDNDIVILEDGSEITVAEFLKTVRTKLVGPAKRKLEEESAPPPGSELKRFMVAKGLLVRKDQLTVGSMRSDHGGRLTLKTTILSMGNTLASKKTYGVVLSFEGDDGSTKGVDHIDFDELAEIAEAIDFMQDLAPKMSREACEYTEVKYASKEGLSFGFYQSPDGQHGFVSTDSNHESAFMPVSRLRNLGDLFKRSREMLLASGAESE
jgi:hypothetical protein